MLIRTMQALESEGRIVSILHSTSTAVRLLTKADGLTFSISEARAQQAGHAELWYQHHWEANYVRAGRATIEDRTSGQRWPLAPGVLYCMGPQDKHRLLWDDARLRIISVCNPPLVGDETHDADGAYPPTGPVPRGPAPSP
jgi:L-ectoine synthase